jgi:ribosomal protein S27AE
MHMQRGIGRAGYRLLASVLFFVGLGGLAMAYYAALVSVPTSFLAIGLAMGATGLVAVHALVWVLSQHTEESFARLAKPKTTPAGPSGPSGAAKTATPSPEAAAPAPAASYAPITFEYPDAQPAAPAAPEEMILPKAFQDSRQAPVEFTTFDEREAEPEPVPARAPGAWPTPRGSHPRAPMKKAAPERDAPTPQRQELTRRYTATTPLVRGVLGTDSEPSHGASNSARTPGATTTATRAPRTAPVSNGEAPLVRAKSIDANFDPDWAPKDKVRGRCSHCGEIMLAPKARPVRLQCPNCEYTKLLE